jgi:capsular exopolysaccharide synthesis family protein
MSVTLPSHATAAWPELRTPPALADQLLALRRHWRLILAVTLLIPGLAALVLWRMAPQYTATAVLLYDPASATPPGGTQPSMGPLDQAALIASQSAIITSLPAAQALAANFNLAARPEFNPALHRHLWSSWFNGAMPQDTVLKTREAISVAVLPDSRILTISFTSVDPALAAAAANFATQTYLNQERDQAFSNLTDAQTWIETHAAALQTQLDETEAELARARAAAGVVDGTQGTLSAETASRLTASLVDAQANLAMAQARISSASNGDAAAANAAIAPNLLPLRKEQADLTAQVRSLAGQYGPDYPELAAAQASLSAITAEINAETTRELDAAKAEMAADQAQVATLSHALSAARTESQTEDAESAPIRALEQRADAGRAMLRDMTLQADQLTQQSALTKPEARILSAAAQPVSPSSPHRTAVLAAAAALGLCLGLLLAGLAEALDTSFCAGGDLRAATGLICMAQVPEIRNARLAPLAEPFSLFSEQLRALRTGLLLSGGAPRVIAVTAARPGDGKTTLTIAFGRALAASGLRVAVVDGDIRQPGFDPVFGLGGAAGLTDYLAGLAPIETIIHRDTHAPLDVIAAGTQGRDALSLFLSAALPACLDALRARYDVVLLDVPPAFALAEARVLARMADAALLCVRWADTPRRVVRAAIMLLQEANVTLAGAVLTRVNPRRQGRSGFADAEMYQPRYGGYFR